MCGRETKQKSNFRTHTKTQYALTSLAMPMTANMKFLVLTSRISDVNTPPSIERTLDLRKKQSKS